jgi:hypothetical protein
MMKIKRKLHEIPQSHTKENDPASLAIFPEILQMCQTGNGEIELGVLACEHGEKFTTSDIYFADSLMFSFVNLNKKGAD